MAVNYGIKPAVMAWEIKSAADLPLPAFAGGTPDETDPFGDNPI
jgi:hypothetical protein